MEAAEVVNVDFSNLFIEHFPELEFFISLRNAVFTNCLLLQDIKLPTHIKKIDEYCFYGCKKLASIHIPESVTVIDHYAFTNCSSLTSIKLPETVEILCTKAFAGCTSLQEINLPNSIYRIDDYCLTGTAITSLTLPTSLEKVPIGIAANCTQLEEIILHDKIIRIEENAFAGCTGLTHINLPPSLKTIGPSAFKNTGITQIQFPNSVYEIGASAFQGLPIVGLSLPPSITKIGNAAFAEIKAPFEITFSDRFQELGAHAFSKSGITAVHFAPGSTVQKIGNYAFYRCFDLKTVDWPQKLLFMGDYAFADCTALESDIILPDGLEELNYHVFLNCQKTKRLVIGKDVRTIKNNVANNSGFSGILTIPGNVRYLCASAFFLTSLSAYIVELPTQLKVEYASFWVENGSSRPIYVPGPYVDWCKTQWAQYGIASIIHDISELEN